MPENENEAECLLTSLENYSEMPSPRLTTKFTQLFTYCSL